MLLLAIHNHQPVGNPEAVLAQAYEQAYLPFLKVLADYPNIKLSLHYSGILLEWFEAVHPDFLNLIGRLVAGGQVEILSGGFYEPVLAAIPDWDKIGQIRKLNDFIFQLFGVRPRGLWLTERVWEPSLPAPLAQAGVEYTLVDSEHFLKSGYTEEELSGYYTTEEAGQVIKIFPGQEKLRYLIPFKPAKETVEYVLAQGDKALAYADDGEKFGLWPGTHAWVYGQGWLDDFFRLLSEARVETWTISRYIDSFPPNGRVYLGTCTYPEMTPWSLPAAAAEALEEVRASSEIRPYLMGGLWRNFLAKYDEANDLHKKMWLVSKKLKELKEKGASRLQEAVDELYKGQCNDAYWHGVFGGLYLPHLRGAAYSHLIQAEKIADEIENSLLAIGSPTTNDKRQTTITLSDVNADGHEEVMVNNREMSLYFAPAKGGCLYEFDYKPKSFNIMNTLTRRREAYHREITREEAVTTLASIHHQALAGAELAEFLKYDTYRRASFLDHFFPVNVTLSDFSRCAYPEAGDFLNGTYQVGPDEGKGLVPFREELSNKSGGTGILPVLSSGRPQVPPLLHNSAQTADLAFSNVGEGLVPSRSFTLARKGTVLLNGSPFPVEVVKQFSVSLDRAALDAHYTITNLGGPPISLAFAVEFNITLEAGCAPDRYYEIPGLTLSDSHLASAGESPAVNQVALIDKYRGLAVRLAFRPAATLWRFPIETVSRSESGLEKIFQSSALLAIFNLSLPTRPLPSWSGEGAGGDEGQRFEADISLVVEEIP